MRDLIIRVVYTAIMIVAVLPMMLLLTLFAFLLGPITYVLHPYEFGRLIDTFRRLWGEWFILTLHGGEDGEE